MGGPGLLNSVSPSMLLCPGAGAWPGTTGGVGGVGGGGGGGTGVFGASMAAPSFVQTSQLAPFLMSQIGGATAAVSVSVEVGRGERNVAGGSNLCRRCFWSTARCVCFVFSGRGDDARVSNRPAGWLRLARTRRGVV